MLTPSPSPPRYRLRLLLYIILFKHAWDIFMVNAHNTKEQTSWPVNKKDLIFSWHYLEVKFTSI